MATFTVTNALSRPITARAQVRTEQPDAAAWFFLQGDAEVLLAVNEARPFNINIAVPPGAASGTYVVHLDVVGVENPDEIAAQGPPVSITYAPAPTAPTPQPWPWIIGGVVVALLIIAAGAFVTLRGDDTEAPPATPAATRTPRPVLRQGDRVPAVRELQAKLTELGFPLNVDGIFGPETAQRVRDFQRSKGLAVDGVVGPQTWTALGFPP
jgi:hypothetical protein